MATVKLAIWLVSNVHPLPVNAEKSTTSTRGGDAVATRRFSVSLFTGSGVHLVWNTEFTVPRNLLFVRLRRLMIIVTNQNYRTLGESGLVEGNE